MAVRTETRRGERRLIIDIMYRRPDGTKGRFRHDAEVQTMPGARAEDRRRMMLLATTGSPEAEVVKKQTTKPNAVTVLTLEELSRKFMGIFAKSQLKASTRRGYQKVINASLIPLLGTVQIDKIDASKAREVDAKLVERNAELSTRRNAQIVLRSMLCRFAVEAKLLPRAPDLPALAKVGKREVMPPSDEALAAIIAAATRRQRRAFLLAAHTGLRAGEIRALRRKDINLDENVLIVRESLCAGEFDTPKSGHERKVPLTPHLRAELEIDLLGEGADDSEEFVTKSYLGRPWGESALNDAFRKAAKAAGYKKHGWHFHDLRHYFVTRMMSSGAPSNVVQQLAGHLHLATTERYSHVVSDAGRSAIDGFAATVRQQLELDDASAVNEGDRAAE